MKKAPLFLIMSLLLPLNTAFAFYSDVPESHTYYNDIKTLYDADKLPDADTFEPDKAANNGDFYTLLISYTQAPLSKVSETDSFPYTNIEKTSPLASYLQTAIDYKILQPNGSSEFPLNLPAKKYNVLKKMFETLGVGINYFYDTANFPFTDIDKDSYIAPIANRAAELNIFEESKKTNFQAFKSLTKGEIAHYLNQINSHKPGETKIIIENSTKNTTNEYEDLDIFLDIWDKLQNQYLYEEQIKDTDKLQYGAIEGLLDQIEDQYTVFEKPETAGGFLSSLSGEFQGVGLTIELIEEKVTVVSPMKGSPAEKAGLKANDVILKVDDQEIIGLTISEVAQKIRGTAGTKVKITIKRGLQELSFDLTRDYLVVESVTSEILTKGNKKIAYISLISFGSTTFKEFQTHIEKMLAEKPKGFILDLRNNPGGFLDVSTQIVSQFRTDSKDTIVTIRYNNGEEDSYYLTGKAGPLAGQKVVVLVNEGSASASEIVAGALQDMKVAKVIGTQTFGKGTAQEVTKYKNGAVFKYTIAEWITPNGRTINGTGITPDEIVKNGSSGDAQLAEALKEF